MTLINAPYGSNQDPVESLDCNKDSNYCKGNSRSHCTIVFSGTILRRIYRRASVHSYACRPVPRVRQGCPDMSRAGYIIRIRIRISISDS